MANVWCPQIHVVSFDNGKISQIRLSWDQGSLLKLIDVIGKTGRNWPIRDGKDQIKLINNSIAAAGKRATGGGIPAQPTGEEQIRRSRENSNNIFRDPHASLSLFAPRDSGDEQLQAQPTVVAPRASAKPPPRDYHDLFVGQDSNSKLESRPDSPHKHSAYGAIASKAGAGKNFQENRLWDTNENNTPQQQSPKRSTNNKNGPSWDFESFQTPDKTVPTKSLVRPAASSDNRHWGTENDEVPATPVYRPAVPRPRKDAETHFVLQDNSPAPVSKINYMENKGITIPGDGSGSRNVQNDDSEVKPQGITIAGDGMGSRRVAQDEREIKPSGIAVAGDGMGSRKAAQDVREVKQKGIVIAGDGMGSKKGGDNWWEPEAQDTPRNYQTKGGNGYNPGDQPHFSFNDESPLPIRNTKENGSRGNVPNSPSRERAPLSNSSNSMSHRNEGPRGINIAGDGMGNRKLLTGEKNWWEQEYA